MKLPTINLAKIVVWGSALFTFALISSLVLYILGKGIPHLSLDLFSLQYNSLNVSLFPALVTTMLITFLSLLLAVPIGIATGIYLVEYAGSKNRFVPLVRLTADTLAGIPSIVYGLFGLLFFVTRLRLGFSVLAGTATLAIMILPLVIRTSEEALLSVPWSWREASFALGTGRWRTIYRIVLPAAMPGILAGVILAIGRITGETAALIYTAGTVPKIPESVYASGRTLAVHMYALSSEGLYTNQAYATAVVLLLLVLFINGCSTAIVRSLRKGGKG